MFIVIRREDRIKLVEFASLQEAQTKMVEYASADAALVFYRVIHQQDGDIVLRRLRVRPGSEQYQTRLVSATFEDDV